ncbi:MAG: hypothetical protein DRJ42_25995 [Deltaproteobacteria bacterium]|nr:MAG: hypothetical protein DRJ42_25995 [Deltaproteobacteria bacterium]
MSWILARFREAFTENVGLKLFALAASIILFSLVHGAEDAQRSVFVDIVAILPAADSDRILVSELPDRVRVSLRGSRSLLNSIRREELDAIQVDLTDTDLSYYYIEPESFELPVGVEIVQLAPASIPLHYAERAEREIPVEAVINGEPGDGLSLSEPVVEPAQVLINGPKPEIDARQFIRTEALNIRGLGAGNYERIVRLDPAPAHASYPNGGSVTVRFQVVPERDERTLAGLEIVPVGPAARVRPTTIDVVVRGAPELIAGIDPDRLVPWVDSASEELSLGGTRPLIVELRGLPSDVEVVSIEPTEVLVTRVPGSATPRPISAPVPTGPAP